MPGHNHGLPVVGAGPSYAGSGPRFGSGYSNNVYQNTGSAGGGGSHDHSLSGSITTGGAGATGSSGTGATGSSGTGATGSSGTGTSGSTTPTAFAPKYVDIILASKD
jgi:hypothetical protein